MKASEAFVKSLEEQGVEFIFGLPGEENLDILEAIRKSDIKFILTRHEQAAGFMAATYGRLTGKPGVCLATLGPGATNLMTSIAFAQLGAMPIVVITGQKPIRKSKQAGFQLIDVVDMMNPVTKYSKAIINAEEIPYEIKHAFRTACGERPGAVHLELAEDVAKEEIHFPTLKSMSLPPAAQAQQKDIDAAVKAIADSKHPLILIGAGANRKPIRKHLTGLIESMNIPFFCTQMGKGVVDERHPLYMGTAALSDNDYVHCAIDHADLILNVGHDIVEKPPFFMEHGAKQVIHINYSAAQIDELYFPQFEVLGDVALNLEEISTLLRGKCKFDLSFYKGLKEQIDKQVGARADLDQNPLLPQSIVAAVRKAVPDDGIITLDNGMYKIWFARNYPSYQPNTILLDNALASMGAGLPAAMAAKMVHPDKTVMAICGDGGFMMNSQELETVVRYNLDLIVIILIDHSLGMIKWKQEEMNFQNFGLDYSNPDFVKYAESYGGKGYSVSSLSEFTETMNKCKNQHGLHVIGVPIDYRENDAVLDRKVDCETISIGTSA